LVSAAQGDCATANLAMRAFVEHSRGRTTNRSVLATRRRNGQGEPAARMRGTARIRSGLSGVRACERAHAGEELARDVLDFVESGPIDSSEQLTTLGIAHGWGGLAFAALRWARAAGQDPGPVVRTRLDELAMLAEPYGAGLRWPVANGRAAFMDGWCNGSAGYAMIYALAYEVLGTNALGEVAERAAISAYQSDITLGTLCCGQAGIGYSLLAVHRITGSPQWLERAHSCARRAAADRSPHFLRDALYKGVVGAALLVEDLQAPATAAMPLFEPLR